MCRVLRKSLWHILINCQFLFLIIFKPPWRILLRRRGLVRPFFCVLGTLLGVHVVYLRYNEIFELFDTFCNLRVFTSILSILNICLLYVEILVTLNNDRYVLFILISLGYI